LQANLGAKTKLALDNVIHVMPKGATCQGNFVPESIATGASKVLITKP
jgi:hypothetical protein